MVSMTILDANILIYSTNTDDPSYGPINSWLKQLFEGPETVGFPWVALWAYLRLSTDPRIWKRPKTPAGALSDVRAWLNQPGAALIHPGPRHADLLEDLLIKHHVVGPFVSDAALAALAIENGATLASTDRDFRRFKGLRWVNPLD